jgi:ABC-type multidrug transport system ATPase subunit
MSGGQRRRLNLTVAAAWAFISALNSGASPSVIFLDEVTMNMDVVGVQGIFRMICELAKEKQVFVIDHNENLLQMLDGCDTINLEMQDEISNKVVDTLATN